MNAHLPGAALRMVFVLLWIFIYLFIFATNTFELISAAGWMKSHRIQNKAEFLENVNSRSPKLLWKL